MPTPKSDEDQREFSTHVDCSLVPNTELDQQEKDPRQDSHLQTSGTKESDAILSEAPSTSAVQTSSVQESVISQGTRTSPLPGHTFETAPEGISNAASEYSSRAGFSIVSACQAKIRMYEQALMMLDALSGVICALMVLWVLKHL